MLVHGDLELALRAVLPVEGGRMVVEVHDPDRHHRDVVVWQLHAAPDLGRLGFLERTKSGGALCVCVCVTTKQALSQQVFYLDSDFVQFVFQQRRIRRQGDAAAGAINVKHTVAT